MTVSCSLLIVIELCHLDFIRPINLQGHYFVAANFFFIPLPSNFFSISFELHSLSHHFNFCWFNNPRNAMLPKFVDLLKEINAVALKVQLALNIMERKGDRDAALQLQPKVVTLLSHIRQIEKHLRGSAIWPKWFQNCVEINLRSILHSISEARCIMIRTEIDKLTVRHKI